MKKERPGWKGGCEVEEGKNPEQNCQVTVKSNKVTADNTCDEIATLIQTHTDNITIYSYLNI